MWSFVGVFLRRENYGVLRNNRFLIVKRNVSQLSLMTLVTMTLSIWIDNQKKTVCILSSLRFRITTVFVDFFLVRFVSFVWPCLGQSQFHLSINYLASGQNNLFVFNKGHFFLSSLYKKKNRSEKITSSKRFYFPSLLSVSLVETERRKTAWIYSVCGHLSLLRQKIHKFSVAAKNVSSFRSHPWSIIIIACQRSSITTDVRDGSTFSRLQGRTRQKMRKKMCCRWSSEQWAQWWHQIWTSRKYTPAANFQLMLQWVMYWELNIHKWRIHVFEWLCTERHACGWNCLTEQKIKFYTLRFFSFSLSHRKRGEKMSTNWSTHIIRVHRNKKRKTDKLSTHSLSLSPFLEINLINLLLIPCNDCTQFMSFCGHFESKFHVAKRNRNTMKYSNDIRMRREKEYKNSTSNEKVIKKRGKRKYRKHRMNARTTITEWHCSILLYFIQRVLPIHKENSTSVWKI